MDQGGGREEGMGIGGGGKRTGFFTRTGRGPGHGIIDLLRGFLDGIGGGFLVRAAARLEVSGCTETECWC